MSDEVRVSVPGDKVASTGTILADLCADLDLPACFTVADGEPSIADYSLLLDAADELADVIFNNRVHLITDDVVRRVARDQADGIEPDAAFAQLVRDLVRHGVKLSRAMRLLRDSSDHVQTFEAALEDAGARVGLRVSTKTKEILVAGRGEAGGWNEQRSQMNDAVFYELGLAHRLADLIVDETVPLACLRLQINDVRGPIVRGLLPDEFFVNDTVERLRLINVKGEVAINRADGTEWAIVRTRATAEACKEAGITVLNAGGFALSLLRAGIRRHAASLLSLSVADLGFRLLSAAFPATTQRAEAMFTRVERARILRSLLREGISIRNLRYILESLITLGAPLDIDFGKVLVFTFPGVCAARPRLSSEVESLTEGVRASLKRQVSYQYSHHQTLEVYLLDPAIEEQLLAAEMPQTFREAFRRAAWDLLSGRRWDTQKKVILTNSAVRARCAEVLAEDLSRVAVVSYHELSPDLNIQPVGRITLPASS